MTPRSTIDRASGVALLPCFWPKAENLRGLGTASPSAGHREETSGVMKIAFVAFEGAGEEAREREYVDAYTREHPDASVVQRVIATSALSAGTRKSVNASREIVGTSHFAPNQSARTPGGSLKAEGLGDGSGAPMEDHRQASLDAATRRMSRCVYGGHGEEWPILL